MILDVKQDDYFFDPTGNNLDAGIKYRIHAAYEPADIENFGYFVGTGQRVYNHISWTNESYLWKPWGICEPEKEMELEFFSKYTKKGCVQECYRSEIIKDCGCVPFNHILDPKRETVRECSSGLR